jgi:hypothetical protein
VATDVTILHHERPRWLFHKRRAGGDARRKEIR